MRDVGVARCDHERVGACDRLDDTGRGRGALGAFVARPRRPRPRACGRRTTPGTRTVPAGVTRCVRSRSSVAGRSRVASPAASVSRAVTPESGAPPRSACGPHEVEPEVEVAEQEPALAAPLAPPSSSVRQRLARPTPAAFLVVEPGERVEHRVEIGRDVHAEHLDVVADVADHRQLAGRERRRGARARASRRRRRPRGTRPSPGRALRATPACVGPPRGPMRSRSAERVDVVDEVPEREVLERQVERGRMRAELRRATRAVERPEDLRVRQPERVRRPVARLDDRDGTEPRPALPAH